MRKRITLLAILALSVIGYNAQAQCAYTGASDFCGDLDASGFSVGVANPLCGTAWGGEHDQVDNMTAGCTYRIETCGTTYDSEVTVFADGGGSALAYSGSGCGDDVSLDFTPTVSGSYEFQVTQQGCVNNVDNTTWQITLMSCAASCTDPDVPSSLNASVNPVCSGNSTTVSWAGNLNDATAWHVYIGSCGGTQITTTTGNSFSVSPTATTTYYIRGEDGAGCVDESSGACGSVTVTVNSYSGISSVTSSANNVCPGTPITLTANGVTAGTGATLTWYTGPGGTGTNLGTGNPKSVTPTANTTYYARLSGTCNTVERSIAINASDVTAPNAVCQNITVFLDGSGNASITAADLDGGSTDNCGTPTLSASQTSFTCADIGANSVTLTATDASANSDNCTATVTVADTTSPVASCQNITVFLDGTGNASISAADVDNGSTDNCSTPSLSLSQSSFTCANIGANNVTLTATDASGNSSTCSAIVTIADTTSPNVVCRDITVYLNGAGNASITTFDVVNAASDNCGVPSLSISTSSFTCANIGANSVTLTATDASGNSSTCISTVTVVDSSSSTLTSASASATNVCASTSVTLTANGLSVSPANSFGWYTGSGGTGSFLGSTSTITVTPSVTTTYYAYLNGTCSDLEESVTVTVTSVTNQSVSTPSSTVACSGDATTVTTSGSQSGVNYFLRNDSNNSIVSGPIAGTGSGLSFNTGAITSSTTFNVLAAATTGALDFDGTNDYVSVPHDPALNITGDITIETWVKRDANTSDWVRLVGKGNPSERTYGLWLSTSGQLLWQRFGTNLNMSGPVLNTNQWYHVAVTTNGNNAAIYVNGVLAVSTTFSGTANSSTQPLLLGYGAIHTYHNGQMDEVRIWNYARSLSEIQDDMNNCLSGSESGLVAYYDFEDGAGSSTLTDKSANGFDGTLTNMDAANDWVSGVSNCSGCTQEMTPTVTISIEAPGSYTADPTNQTVCDGGNATFAISGTGAVDNVTWQVSTDGGSTWTNITFSGVYSGNDTTLNITGATTGLNGNLYRSIADKCGVDVDSTTAASLTVNTTSSITSATASTNNICSGTAVTLTANGVSAGTGASFSWYTGTGGTGTNLGSSNPLSVSPATTTTYYAYLSGTCNTVERSITVNVNQTSSSIGSVTASTNNICPNTSVQLTANSVTTGSGATLTWYTGAGGTGSNLGTSNPLTVSPANTTTYYARLAGTCNTVEQSITVVIDKTESSLTSATASSTSICSGTSIQLTANGVSAGSGATLTWYTGAGGTGSNLGTSNPLSATPAATTTYYARLAGTCNTVERSVTVTVTPTDDPSFSYSSGTYCISGTNPTPTVTGDAGTFSGSGALVINGTTGQIDLTASGTGSYVVTYTTSGTCSASSTANITITNAPNATFSYAGTQHCQSGTLSPTFSGGASAGTFSATPAGLVINTSSGVIDLSSSSAGTYTVTNSISAGGGCSATSANTTVTVLPVATSSQSLTQCDSVTINGNTYYSSQTVVDTLTGQAANGCDSIVTTNLTINISGSYTQDPTDVTLCDAGDATFMIDGTGYADSLFWQVSADGGTSWSNIVLPTGIYSGTEDSLQVTGATSAEDGYMYRSVAYACGNRVDSTTGAMLTVNVSTSSTQNVTTCGTYTWSATGLTYSTDGTYTTTTTNAAGCDSNMTLNLTIATFSLGTTTVNGCDSAVVFGNTYFSNTTVYDTIVGGSATGCDTITEATVVISPSATGTDAVSGCDMVMYGGDSYTSSTTIMDTLVAANGCDSVVTVTITVSNSASATIDTTIAFGDSISIGSSVYDSSGTYTDTLVAANGCDSVITTNLSVTTLSINETLTTIINVYPNPVHRQLQVKSESVMEVIHITDIHGRRVLSVPVNQLSATLDVSTLSNGMYVYEVQLQDGHSVKGKLVKQK